ncbi:hypothetical protein MHB_0003470 [Pseudomonas fluorescens BBc6R8]|uniref:hypothetical protein n=1 Tax=Pseudomonas fluorescens TaxID=294 RepID=UPI000281CA31|nr:hypothetical protein [Pseudomonas fluorescens]QQD55349.1 hypothetical protein MHB_0003470 [Pseudomonas fluorescens BBc6R8]
MTDPIRVYLDSSDFSNISRPTEKNAASIQIIRSKLLNWVENGDIEIRYSMAHIMEAVPVDIDTAELGRLRLNCIKELCGSKVFADPITLVTQELSGSKNTPLMNNDGYWFPGAGELWGDEIDVFPEPPKNRQQRRLEKSALKKTAIKSISDFQKLFQEYPIKKNNAFIIFEKPGSGEAVAKALQNSVNDLDFLCNWYIKNWSRSTEYSKAVRGAGKEFSALLTTSANDIKALHTELMNGGTHSSEIQKHLMIHAKELADNVSQEMIDSLSKGRVSQGPKVIANLESTPSLYVFSKLMAQIFLSSVVAVKNTRKARDSDMGDLIHSMYIPYVDIFRADLATANGLRNAKLSTKTKIVTSLDELVVELESLVAARKPIEPGTESSTK